MLQQKLYLCGMRATMDGMTIDGTDFHLPNQTAVYHGKVRDVYAIGSDKLVCVASDRISAFDVILPRPIPYKGQVLNQLAAHFLETTAEIAPNWLLSVPDPNVSFGYKCEPFQIEMVIRSCLVGHSWRVYERGIRELCGVSMPEEMQEYDQFPEPIITPSTKAKSGHDEDISALEIIERGLATEAEFEQLSTMTRDLFDRGQAMAKERGLFLADTKYEFGRKDGKIYVIDEIHTPDSSRYFYADSYDTYLQDRSEKPRNLSKEFVRQWLLEKGFSGLVNQHIPDMDDEFIQMVSSRYIELYEQLTGKKFEKPPVDQDPLRRIEENIKKALA
jgi:phosphoribosylaminoimidazole-succinocarboxamide synthase